MPKQEAGPPERRALGSVYYSAAHGSWCAEINLGLDSRGKRKTIKRYFKGSEKDRKVQKKAEAKLAELIADSGRGALVNPQSITVAEWLDQHLKRWNSKLANTSKKENDRLARIITEKIGRIQLQAIQPYHIQQVIDDSEKFAHRSRMKILQLLRRAFAEAVSLEVISKNPAANIRAPRAPRAEGKTGIAWTREEVQKFLEVAREYRLYPLYCLAFSIGARIGEIQALKIDDLNLQDGTLNIQRSVSGRDDKTYPLQISGGKTEAARRKVRLPEDVKPILAAWLFRLEEDRKAAGPQWNEEGWLFPSMNGKLLRYIPFWQNFQIVLKRSGIRTGTIHDMRRTFITLAIRSGVLPEVVAKIVGHSSVRITLEEYRRVQDDELENAAVTLTGLLG